MANWIVKVKMTVEKEFICYGCTEGQARESPFEYIGDDEDDWVIQEGEVKEHEVIKVAEEI